MVLGSNTPPLRPTFTLAAGGLRSSSDNPVAGLDSLVVDRDMDVPADALRLRLEDRSGISVGDGVIVELGHDGQEETVFTGAVEVVRPSITGAAVLALGTMNGLLNFRTSIVFANQSAGSIASTLIGQSGLSAGTIDDGPELPRYVVDRALSAYRHLRDLADRFGYELYADRDGNVMFRALGPGAGLDGPGGLVGTLAGAAEKIVGGGEGYAFGRQLLGARAGERGVSWGTIEVGGESPMSRQGEDTEYWLTTNDTDYRGSAGSGEPGLLVRDPAARTRDLADRFAAGRLAVASRVARETSITVLGRPGVDLGEPVSVKDVPDAAINGGGYVRAVRHRFGEGEGFVTDLRICMEAGS